MTTDELAREMAKGLKENITLKEMQASAAAKGFTPEQIKTALDEAHTLVQQEANSDPFIRLFLGPGLLMVAFVAFYTDWAGRSVGFGSFLGLILFLVGGRITLSLLRLWMRPKKKI